MSLNRFLWNPSFRFNYLNHHLKYFNQMEIKLNIINRKFVFIMFHKSYF